VQIRRRLTAARELAEQMIQHPFFNDTSESAGCKAVQTTLRRKIRVLEDHINRCNELAEQTNVLISLIYNTATLQETKAANSFAASIRRVTMLTFIYLPLSLASVRRLPPSDLQITDNNSRASLE
jgi:Mg2+ and Co2+ transporter CorA